MDLCMDEDLGKIMNDGFWFLEQKTLTGDKIDTWEREE